MRCVGSKKRRSFFLPALLVLVMSLTGCAAVAVTKTATTVTKTAVKATGAAAGLAVKGVKAAVGSKDKSSEDDTSNKDG
ncbi:MAG: hypothetical protein ACR2OX_11070 [Methyloligellaceae bacterium]